MFGQPFHLVPSQNPSWTGPSSHDHFTGLRSAISNLLTVAIGRAGEQVARLDLVAFLEPVGRETVLFRMGAKTGFQVLDCRGLIETNGVEMEVLGIERG